MYIHTPPRASIIPIKGGKLVSSLNIGTKRRLPIPRARIVICSLRVIANGVAESFVDRGCVFPFIWNVVIARGINRDTRLGRNKCRMTFMEVILS